MERPTRVSRKQAASRAANASRKLRNEGWMPVGSGSTRQGLHVISDMNFGGVQFRLDMNGRHGRINLLRELREDLAKLGYVVGSVREMIHSRVEGSDYEGTIWVDAWMPKWNCVLATLKVQDELQAPKAAAAA